MAATAWYHNKIDRKGRSADDVAAEAARFAGDVYVKALFAGDRLESGERAKIAAKRSDVGACIDKAACTLALPLCCMF